MTYDEFKPAVVASSTYLTSDMERRDEAVALQSRIDVTKGGTGLDSNQCAYCLKRNNRWRESRSYLNGKLPAERPPGMSPTRKFPPPPKTGRSNNKRKDGPRAFMAMKAVRSRRRANCRKIFSKYPCSRRPTVTAVSTICDTGANVYMTPCQEDLRNTRTVNRRCTFGNKGQLQALAMGEMPLHVKLRAPIKVTLKDVLWTPGLYLADC